MGGASGEPAECALSCARRIASCLDDPLALAECDFLEGWCWQGKSDYTRAATCFASAVDRLKRVRDHDPRAGDAAFELRALAALAVYRFLRAEYADAERRVEEGLDLSRGVPAARSARATLLWTRALLQRWRGNLEEALTCACNSADLLERDAHNAMFGRIQGIAGEIALDLAARHSAERPAHGRTVWLAIGRAASKRPRASRMSRKINRAWGWRSWGKCAVSV